MGFSFPGFVQKSISNKDNKFLLSKITKNLGDGWAIARVPYLGVWGSSVNCDFPTGNDQSKKFLHTCLYSTKKKETSEEVHASK